MTYDEFWYGPAELTIYQHKAERLRMSRENQDQWRLGGYFYNALCASIARCVGGNRGANYLEAPMVLVHEQEENKEREKQKLLSFLDGMKQSHKKSKEGGANGV